MSGSVLAVILIPIVVAVGLAALIWMLFHAHRHRRHGRGGAPNRTVTGGSSAGIPGSRCLTGTPRRMKPQPRSKAAAAGGSRKVGRSSYRRVERGVMAASIRGSPVVPTVGSEAGPGWSGKNCPLPTRGHGHRARLASRAG